MKPEKVKGKLDFKNFSAKDKIVIIAALILIGILLVSISGLFTSKASTNKSVSTEFNAANYKDNLELQLKNTLSLVSGVGKVDVMITLEGEVNKEIAYNETTSGSSSSDTSTRSSEQTTISKDAIMVKDGSATTPYTVEDKYPEVVGVIIVAEGGSNSQTKANIIDAVKTALGIPSYKIVVLPKSNK